MRNAGRLSLILGPVFVLGAALLGAINRSASDVSPRRRVEPVPSTSEPAQEIPGRDLAPVSTETPAKEERIDPPAAVLEDSTALRHWILDLPDNQFRMLVGTALLDEYVCRAYSAASPEDEAFARWLGDLNSKIERGSRK